MKKTISISLILVLLLSMTTFAQNTAQVPQQPVSARFQDMITTFFETKAHGFNVLTNSQEDVTEMFYAQNLANYSAQNWTAIRDYLMFNCYVIALPIEHHETIATRNSDEVTSNFTRSYYEPFVIYGQATAGEDVYINDFFYQMLCTYVYSNNQRVIVRASSTLAMITTVGETVGYIAYQNMIREVFFAQKLNVQETARITNDGTKVTFGISFSAVFREMGSYTPSSYIISQSTSIGV